MSKITMTQTKDLRAQFTGLSEPELRKEQATLMRREGNLQRALSRARPTRHDAEEAIDKAQAVAAEYVERAIAEGVWAANAGGITIDAIHPDVARMASAA